MKLSRRQRRTARKLFLPLVALVMMTTAMAAASAGTGLERDAVDEPRR